ncbi:tetratricopeptide repeat protein [Micromonospora rifamycinica]|uniref:tetratricopeptide repeat protein n=1 Tax=Micromonospora rifamycinica TaxID=291594 RepID=UPI002E27E18C|nr:tetratricopeptide repeat protein [Micromonospora rifamycinica]
MTDDESTLDGYRQRSQLLAELGRYDEAAEELGFALALAPADPSALTLLARLHLAAGRPGAAIAAADAAIGGPPHPPEAPTAFAPPAPSGSPTSSAPSEPPGSSGAPRPVGSAAPSEPPGSPEGPQPVGPPGPPSSRPGPPVGSGPPGEAPAVVPTAALVIRAIALADLGEYAESARTADRILAAGPTDAYAQRSAAAILAEARNGQPALDAAWRGVELAPDEPQAHLVLALVAGRLELFDLAERAYREALRLDPELAGARDDPGVLRLERRRWVLALEQVAALAPVHPTRAEKVPVWAGLRRLVLIGCGWSLVTSLLLAVLAAGGAGASRLVAVLAAAGGGLLAWRLASQVPELGRVVLPVLRREDRPLAFAVYAVPAGPALLLLFALVGSPWPLVAAIAVAVPATLVAGTRAGVS